LPANVTLVPGSLSGSGPLTCQLLGQMVSCTAVSLPANQPEVVRFAVIPNNPGPLFNHAAIQAAEPDANTVNNADSTTTLVGGTGVDVGVQKTAAQAIIPLGQPLTYTLDIFNNSNANATGVVVTDTLPASMAFNGTATSTGALSCQLVAQQIVCDLPLLPAGQQEQIHIFVTPTLTGTFTNVADIRAAEPDPFPFNNSDSAVTLVIAPQTPTVDLHLEKTVSAAAAVLDMPFTYTLSLRNNGPDPATGVVVTDTLPANVLLVSATSTSGLFSCQPAAVGVVCQTPVLDPGAADTILLRVVAGLPGPALNFARAAAAELDLQPGNNADSVFTLITASSDPGLFDITPGSGANTGPTPVTVRGFNFEPASQLYLSRLGQRFPLSGMQFVDAFTLRGTAPAGLAPGVYNLLVENSDGSQARLLDAFIVYGGGPPVVTAVSPPSGPDNRPMRIDIAGSNFARPVLAALSDGSTLYPLGGVDVLHDGRVQATVPISLTPGVYDVVIRNPNQLSGTLPAAYTVLDATLLDDLFGFAYEFGTRPASPIVGQNTELGFYVYRQGGQQPLSDVEVAFYDGPPAQAGSSLIAQVIIPTLAPNARVPLTTTWTPAAAGLHTLHVVVDPNDGVPESDEQNNTYAHPVYVRPAQADSVPPQVTAFTIDGGALSTNQRQVVLDTTATDNVGVAYLLFIEYIFSQNADSWLPVQASGWLTRAGAHAAHEWRLAPWPGAHYLQVWAADAAGNVPPRPGQARINAWPVDTDIPIGHAQGHVFRWPLQA
ncbi:MAG: DUF11 domain-containing protein, partial [Anaerolineales bacterium]|nr:DUF11 domain-containing protein [Anaerolineales bacterium]